MGSIQEALNVFTKGPFLWESVCSNLPDDRVFGPGWVELTELTLQKFSFGAKGKRLEANACLSPRGSL